MYTFTHLVTGKQYSYKTRRAASNAKDCLDNAYGRVVTSFTKYVEVTK